VSSSAGPARKYYQPTPDGHAALTAGTANWQSLAHLVNAVLTGPTLCTPTEGSPR
jgi:PadR family transcriptional regulator PadR